jgi:hypothetical protein
MKWNDLSEPAKRHAERCAEATDLKKLKAVVLGRRSLNTAVCPMCESILDLFGDSEEIEKPKKKAKKKTTTKKKATK